MSDQYVGEIRVFGCNYAPSGWAQCNGQLLSIAQNTALYSVLGTSYGGDGKVTFALPDLQGAASVSAGNGPGLTPYGVGESNGVASVTLGISEMPAHTHAANAKTSGTSNSPIGALWSNPSGRPAPSFLANSAGTSPAMNAQAVAPAGGNVAHNNLMPYQVLNFCIALNGNYPLRT